MPADIRADSEIQPDAGIPKPQLDVVAHPVDTYVKPVSASASALGQLAGALKGLNPALDEVESRFKQAAVQQGQTQAESAFQQVHGDYGQAVKEGLIPTVLNPFARMAARETFGHLAADKFHSDMWGDKDFLTAIDGATTMQQYDSAVSQYQAKWSQANLGHDTHSDPLFQSAFQGLQAEHMKDDRQKFTTKVNENFVGSTLALNVANVSSIVNGAIEDGSFTSDPSHLTSTIEALGQKLRSQGFSDKFVSNVMSEGLSSVAEDAARGLVGDGSLGAEDVLRLAHHISGYGGNELWESMGDKRSQIMDKALSQEIQQARANKYQDMAETKEKIHSTYDELYQDQEAGKLKPMEYYRDKLLPVDDREARRFPTLYADLHGDTWKDVPTAVAKLSTGIQDPSAIHFTTTKDALADALHSHEITPQTYMKLSKDLDGHNNPKGRQKTALTDEAWKTWHETSRAGVMMGDPSYGPNRSIGGAIVGNVALQFQDWYGEHPGASYDEKWTKLQELEHTNSLRYGGQAYRDYQTDNPGLGHQGMVKPEEWAHQKIVDPDMIKKLDAGFRTGKTTPEMWEYLKTWGITDPRQAALIVN